jgi:hypothetical protein
VRNGASDDAASGTKDRTFAEGEDRAGGVARAGDGEPTGAAPSDAPEPARRLEDAAAGAGGAGVRARRRARGRRGAREIARRHVEIGELTVEREVSSR